MTRWDRTVTPVVSTILVVGIIMVLDTTISVSLFSSTEDLNEAAPIVSQTSGEFEPRADAQRVRITHISGGSVPAEELETVVRVSGPDVDTESRLVNLAEFDAEKDPENTMSYFNEEVKSNDSNTWGVGDTIQFEITVGGADFDEPPVGGNPDAD